MPDLRPDSPNNHGMQERTTLGENLPRLPNCPLPLWGRAGVGLLAARTMPLRQNCRAGACPTVKTGCFLMVGQNPPYNLSALFITMQTASAQN